MRKKIKGLLPDEWIESLTYVDGFDRTIQVVTPSYGTGDFAYTISIFTFDDMGREEIDKGPFFTV